MNKMKEVLKACFIRESKRDTIIIFVAFAFLLFQSYRTFIQPLQPMLLRPLHTMGMIIICYLCNPITKKMKNPLGWKKYLMAFDYLVLASTPVMIWYYITNYERLNLRILYLDPLTTMDIIVGVWLVIVVLEGIRRSLGLVLTVFISIFIVYGFVSKYLPGILYYRGLNITKAVDLFCMSTDGLYGSALGACASFIFWIMLFGAVFAECGGGNLMVDLGMLVGNRSGDNSGPAKASVIGSCFEGMISGSAAANVAGSGVITIPLMKKVGYTPEEAGAIEAMASTGGQIMPPIMGAGAFLMAEMLGISYFVICKAALLPALGYYLSIFVVVHYIAKRRSHEGTMPTIEVEIPPILPRLYLLLPIGVLVVMMGSGFTIQRAALYALGLTLLIAFFGPKKYRTPVVDVVNCVLDSTRRVAEIGIPIAGCGIIVGVVNMSGIASRMSQLITELGSQYLWIGLIITALGCMILGMALPTIAAYLTAYVLFMPTLLNIGIELLPANLFIFYFGIFAQITPPVCVASYTAAGIAGGNAWKTGWKSFSYCFGAFLAPFLFVYRPGILMLEGTTIFDILYATGCLYIGIFLISLGMAGYFRATMKMPERLMFGVAGIAFAIPHVAFDVIGVVLGAVLIFSQFVRGKKQAKIAAAG